MEQHLFSPPAAVTFLFNDIKNQILNNNGMKSVELMLLIPGAPDSPLPPFSFHALENFSENRQMNLLQTLEVCIDGVAKQIISIKHEQIFSS